MTELMISNAAKETVTVLEYFEPKFIAKIPDNFLNMIKELSKQSNIMVSIDKSKGLEEQNISEQCKDMIALIYYSYIATEEEKGQILKKWDENEKTYQQNIHQQYDPDNLFKNKKHMPVEENMQLIQYEKEGFFERLLNKIKKLFKI